MRKASNPTTASPGGERGADAPPRVLQDLEHLLGEVEDYGVYLMDPEGRVQTWNQGARRLKGWEAGEVLGRHFSLFYPEEDAATGKPAMELGLAEAYGTYQEEGWRVRKDGSRFQAHV